MEASVDGVESAAPELIEHVRQTRADARRLAAQLEGEMRAGPFPGFASNTIAV